MNGTRPKRATTPNPPARIVVDELEAASQRANRRRKVFSIIVLAPLVFGLLATSVYTFFPQVPADPGQDGGTQTGAAVAGDPAAAGGQIAALESAVTQNPQDYAALVALGNAYYDQHRFPDAESVYKRALAIDGSNPDVRVDYGTALFYQNRTLEAIGEYQTALKANPKHINAKVNLGMAFQAMNQPERAAAAWTEALALADDPVLKQRIQDMISRASRTAKGG